MLQEGKGYNGDWVVRHAVGDCGQGKGFSFYSNSTGSLSEKHRICFTLETVWRKFNVEGEE